MDFTPLLRSSKRIVELSNVPGIMNRISVQMIRTFTNNFLIYVYSLNSVVSDTLLVTRTT